MANERINTIIKQTTPHYAEASPLILEAHALHEYITIGRRIAQLKWRNITQKNISAVMVELVCYDSFNHKLESKVHHYDQLNIYPNKLFGDQIAVLLPDSNTVRYEVLLKAVTWLDGEVWENETPVPFEVMPESNPLTMENSAYLSQYQRDVKAVFDNCSAAYEPQQHKGLWQCACGGWQPVDNACLTCGADASTLQEMRNGDTLQQHLETYEAEQERLRLEREEQARKQCEEQEALQKKLKEEEAAARAAEKKRTKKIAAILAAVLVLVVALLIADKMYFQSKAQYNLATKLMEYGDYIGAMQLFSQLDGFSDSEEKAKECWYLEGESLLNAENPDYAGAKTAFENAGEYKDADTRYYELCYLKGESLLNAENPDYAGARIVFEKAGDYKPERKASAKLRITECWYLEGVQAVHNGEFSRAMHLLNKIPNYKDTKDQIAALRSAFPGSISVGSWHTVGLKANGTVVAAGRNREGQCDVSSWTDIVAISAGATHTVGLKVDGTVMAVGRNTEGQCEVRDWKDIVSISAGATHTVGLKVDGTVVAVGRNAEGQCKVSDWKDIVAISAGVDHTVGLKANGTVLVVGKNNNGQSKANDWKDIIAISVGVDHTVGLKADGSVVTKGRNDNGQCNVGGWTDVIAISAGGDHTVGLKTDGIMVAVGNNGYDQCKVSDWTDIVAISAGAYHTIGLKSDGTVVAVGSNASGQCDVSDWKLKDN